GPGEALDVTLDKLDVKSGRGERFLNFRFYQREDTPWVSAGYEVAWEQLALPARRSTARPKDAPTSDVTMREEGVLITLRAGSITASFDKSTGILSGFGAKDTSALKQGPQLNVWRAGTDNDGIKLQGGQEWKALPRWLALGLNHAKSDLQGV